ncbi:MAG: hypothetical protein CL940_00970 [Deltaproteobacteria bacterium]|nr:hypothetical protein [Deltaproteobacteria bacterium]
MGGYAANMSAMRNDLLCLFVVCGLAACADSNSAGSGEPGFSAVSGAYVATADPGTCGLWTTVTPPEDFDAICRGGGEDLQALELSMWEMVNADRAEHNEEANGAAPVGYDCAVAEVARIHSYDQCKAAQLAHELNGKTPGDRLEHYLQLSFGADFFTYGENVAWYPDLQLQAAEDGFVEEEPPCDLVAGGHRLNILSDDFEAIGVGYCACAGDPNFYVTQNFITFDPGFAVPGNAYCDANFPGWGG